MVGILLSYWKGPFSGAMLVLGRVGISKSEYERISVIYSWWKVWDMFHYTPWNWQLTTRQLTPSQKETIIFQLALFKCEQFVSGIFCRLNHEILQPLSHLSKTWLFNFWAVHKMVHQKCLTFYFQGVWRGVLWDGSYSICCLLHLLKAWVF